MPIVKDENGDEWELVPARPKPPKAPKGIQCGVCGMRFEHGKSYGYVCTSLDCPIGLGPVTC